MIFTTGAAGSSVLTGILARQGFYLGRQTAKLDFDTFENADLVALNMKLLRLSGYLHRDANDLPPPDVQKLEDLAETIDVTRYLQFLEECEAHRPWIWKDPRLTYTIHFWKRLMAFDDVNILVMSREFAQAYAGLILKRRVYMHPGEYRQILNNYHKSLKRFLGQFGGHNVLELTFEEFLLHPSRCIDRMNAHFGTTLSMDDVTTVYRGPLFRKRYSTSDYVRAVLQYTIKKYLFHDVITFPRAKARTSS